MTSRSSKRVRITFPSHPFFNHTGTIDLTADGTPVLVAPDGIGRRDRIKVTMDDGRVVWCLEREIEEVEHG